MICWCLAPRSSETRDSRGDPARDSPVLARCAPSSPGARTPCSSDVKSDRPDPRTPNGWSIPREAPSVPFGACRDSAGVPLPPHDRPRRIIMYGMDPDRLAVVCRTHGVRLLLQFGSTVSGREHAASDVDLAVLLERGRVLWTHTS